MSSAVNENLIVDTIEPALGLATPSAPVKKIPGMRKAAVFLAQMSSEEAGVVLSRLRASEVEMLTTEIMRLRNVDPGDANEVMDEFHQMMQARQFIGQGGAEFARETLTAALGKEKADELLSRLNVVFTEMPFASLRNADVRQIATFLKEEHPQIIALVLVHLQSQQSAEVLSRLSPELQAEVALRIATMDRTAPEIIAIIETELSRRIGSVAAHHDMATVGGVDVAGGDHQPVRPGRRASHPGIVGDSGCRVGRAGPVPDVRLRGRHQHRRPFHADGAAVGADPRTRLCAQGCAGGGPFQGHQQPVRACPGDLG